MIMVCVFWWSHSHATGIASQGNAPDEVVKAAANKKYSNLLAITGHNLNWNAIANTTHQLVSHGLPTYFRQHFSQLAHNTNYIWSLGPDPNVLSELFEDWLAADRNWLQSSCYLNAKRSREEKRKGSWQMRDKSWLVEKYGEALATSIVASKWELQKNKPASDPTEYAMFDPEVPNSTVAQLCFISSLPVDPITLHLL